MSAITFPWWRQLLFFFLPRIIISSSTHNYSHSWQSHWAEFSCTFESIQIFPIKQFFEFRMRKYLAGMESIYSRAEYIVRAKMKCNCQKKCWTIRKFACKRFAFTWHLERAPECHEVGTERASAVLHGITELNEKTFVWVSEWASVSLSER